LSKVKEIKGLRGGIRWYAAQAIPPIDAEIGQKDHLWMETNYIPAFPGRFFYQCTIECRQCEKY